MPPESSAAVAYDLEILADHFQILFEDCHRDWDDIDLDTLYGEDARERHLGVVEGTLCSFIARWFGPAHLKVVIRRDPPGDDISVWDNVVEANLDVPSGCLVAYGPKTRDRCQRLSLHPGQHQARVCAGAIATVDAYMRSGLDHYQVVLWPAPLTDPAVLRLGPAHVRW